MAGLAHATHSTIRAFGKWLKELPLSEPKRKVLTDNIAKTEEWWSHQPSDAIETVERVAVMMGIPVSLLGKNYDALNLLRAMTAAISLTNWLAPRLPEEAEAQSAPVPSSNSPFDDPYHLPFDPLHHDSQHPSFSRLPHHPNTNDGACRNPWSSTQPEAEVNFGRMYRSYILVGINASYPQPLSKAIFPVSKRLHSFHPHHEHATQVLHWLCNASYSGQGVQSFQKVPSTHQWTTCTSWASTALLAGTWQPVYLGTSPNLHWKSRLSQSWNGHHPRMATRTQLSLHLSIFSPQERHPQKTCLEYQCPVWLGHIMASCKTQVYSKTGSSDLDVHTVSKPSGTLDHYPRPRVKYKGQIRTNQDATIQWWRTYPLLCSSPPGQQHSGAFSHSLPECYRCLHQMVEWKIGPSGHCTPGPMVPSLQTSNYISNSFYESGIYKFLPIKFHAIHHPSRWFSSNIQLSSFNSAITSRQSLTGPPHNRPYAVAKTGELSKLRLLIHPTLIGSWPVHFFIPWSLRSSGSLRKAPCWTRFFHPKKNITTSFDWAFSAGPSAMVYLPCHIQTSPTFAKKYGQNIRNRSPATSPNPPSINSKKPSKVTSSIAKTNHLRHCLSTARASTTNPSNKHFKTLPFSNRYLKTQLPLSHHLLRPSNDNTGNPTTGQSATDDNYRLDTSWQNERKVFGVAGPSSPLWTLRFALCLTSLLASSSSWSQWRAQTTLRQGMSRLFWPFSSQRLSTPISFWSTRILLDSSPALTKTDSWGPGSCSSTSFDPTWMCQIMKHFLFIQERPTIQGTSSKAAPFVASTSLGRSSSRTFQT